jgi:hypothetical protein
VDALSLSTESLVCIGSEPGVEIYHVWEKLDKLVPVKMAKGLYGMTVKVEAVAGLNLDYYTLTPAR